MKNGRIAIVDTSGKDGKIWRHIIQDRATQAMEEYANGIVLSPVSLYVKFTIARPRYHYGKGKNDGVLLPKFRYAKHVSKPDTTKLVRALEDALTGVVWKDDAQVFSQYAHKVYGQRDETLVRVFLHNHETDNE